MKNRAIVVAALAGLGLTSAANAAIVSTSSNVVKISRPSDARQNVLTSTNKAKTWVEAECLSLNCDIKVDAKNAGLYDRTSDLGNYTIKAGTMVSSHYISFDTPGQQSGNIVNGSVTFDKAIVGVIVMNKSSDRRLDKTDALFSNTRFTKNESDRGLELVQGGDLFRISNDRKTITFCFDINNCQPGDAIRVLTECVVPTPGTAALMGIGALAIGRRRRAA